MIETLPIEFCVTGFETLDLSCLLRKKEFDPRKYSSLDVLFTPQELASAQGSSH